jgi:Transposase DDE domain
MKTGARRYGVLVQRERAVEVVMNPAPGYDEYLPHDMLHFVAEAEWKLDGAVFGQLAAGGDAGYFSEDNIRITSEHGLDPHIATGRFKHSEPPPPAPRGPIAKNAIAKQRMARKLRTKKGRAVYSRRKVIVERVFGQIDTVQNGRRLLVRSKHAARQQWRLHCAVHNLLKLHRAGGLALINQQGNAGESEGSCRNRTLTVAGRLVRHAIQGAHRRLAGISNQPTALLAPQPVTAPGS